MGSLREGLKKRMRHEACGTSVERAKLGRILDCTPKFDTIGKTLALYPSRQLSVPPGATWAANDSERWQVGTVRECIDQAVPILMWIIISDRQHIRHRL